MRQRLHKRVKSFFLFLTPAAQQTIFFFFLLILDNLIKVTYKKQTGPLDFSAAVIPLLMNTNYGNIYGNSELYTQSSAKIAEMSFHQVKGVTLLEGHEQHFLMIAFRLSHS